MKTKAGIASPLRTPQVIIALLPVALLIVAAMLPPAASLNSLASKRNLTRTTPLAPRERRQPAQASTRGIVLTPINQRLIEPVALDYHAPSNQLVLALRPAPSEAYQLELMTTDGGRRRFSSFSTATGKVRLAVARERLGNIAPGEVFLSAAPAIIARLAADGTSVTNNWAQLPGEKGMITALRLAAEGTFRGRLIAATEAGRLWMIDDSGKMNLMADLATPLAGLLIVPDDAARYGDWAGKLLVGAKAIGGVYAVDAYGKATYFNLPVYAHEIEIIPENEDFFGIDSQSGILWKAPASQFAGVVGSILIAQDRPANLLLVRWTGKTFSLETISQAMQWEQFIFAPACVTSISPTSALFQAEGGTGLINISAPGNCNWNAVVSAPWIALTSPASGLGNGQISFNVDANRADTARQGKIEINGISFIVEQEGRAKGLCGYAINPHSDGKEAVGGIGTINISTKPSCAWRATSDSNFVTITPPDSGIGTGGVTYSVAPNGGGVRSARITIGGETLNIKQKANQPPVVNAGPDQTITLPNTAALSGTVIDDNAPVPAILSWTQVSGPATAILGSASNALSTAIFASTGTYVLRLTASDTVFTASDDVVITVNPDPVPPPPDPMTVAPPINNTVVTTIGAATQFLYSGPNPIQTGVAPGTISMVRAAVLRGRVLDKSGTPLQKVKISVLNHPELGQTLSRADGKFDLAVNGGGLLTLKYEKTGFLPVQRQENVPWQDYVMIADVVMMSYDPQVTFIDLSANIPMQVAQGTTMTDNAGTRRATLLFRQGTTATMKLPDGSMQGLIQLHVRATEYTVGANGPAAMPGDLPATSHYTYAVEYSVDEAVAVAAKAVLFSQPVIQYLDNFLAFPVGIIVPVGSYDRDSGIWMPEASGRVVKILSIAGGQANLDVTGSGQPATDAEYAALGVTIAERQRAATLFAVGQSFWRVPVAHLSPWDLNWPFASAGSAPNQTVLGDKQPDSPDCECNSIIECQGQVLGESVGITGTPFSLNYRSNRVLGRQAAYTLTIPLIGPTVPPGLLRIELETKIAGRSFKQTFPNTANQTTSFTWDGKDAYGRTLQGQQPVTARISYIYGNAVYLEAVLFGGYGDGIQVGLVDLRCSGFCDISLSRTQRALLGPWDARGQGLGAWSLSEHHTYDPIGQVVYMGSGQQRRATAVPRVITRFAGGGNPADGLGDGLPARDAKVSPGFGGITVAPDGSVFIADMFNHRVRKVGTNGIINTVAGTGIGGYNGDNILATQARLNQPDGLALGPDGSIYISDRLNNRVRKVAPNGIITTVAGTGTRSYSGDGGPATQAELTEPLGLAIGRDGSLFVCDPFDSAVRRVAPDGIITSVVGSGSPPPPPPAKPIKSRLTQIAGTFGYVAVGPDGLVYLSGGVILRVNPDGTGTVVAGGGVPPDFLGDGLPATQAYLGDSRGFTVGPDGSLYITQNGLRLRAVGPDGIIATIAGDGNVCSSPSPDGTPARQARFCSPAQDVALGPDGSLYVVEAGNNGRITKVSPSMPGFSAGDIAIPSEDGTELYQFDFFGRHLRTVNTLTGATLYQFTYNGAGRLTQITDGDGNITTVERNANGDPTAIVAPFGQRTTLTLNANGYLSSVTDPASQSHQFAYAAGGLLTSFTNPRNQSSTFIYDATGRLTKDTDAATGFKAPARTEQSNGYAATLTTALNRTTIYQVQNLTTGDLKRINTDSAGLQTQTIEAGNGVSTTTSPDGMVDTLREAGDPRWGMQASLPATLTSKTPANLLFTSTFSRTVTLSDPNNLLSLTAQNDTSTINGRAYTNNYAAATRTFTFTTPVGRQRTTVTDTQGRITQSQFSNLNPANFTYDARGRLFTAVSGAGAAARSFSFSYNTEGYLSSITDPLTRTRSFVYDAAGRITQKTLPDGRIVGFGYDANGNITSITPPGRPAHAFAYSPVDLRSSYTAPNVGVGNQTTYAYNLDRQVTTITRPDNQALNFAYDSGARLSTLTIPGGVYTFAYNATTGNLASVTAPGGSTLSYTYDGALLTRTTWAGTIAGNVSRTFDNNFRVTSQSINSGNTINFTYDNDSLLTGAGSLSLTRNAQNGLITGATLGNSTDTRTYSGFAEVTNYSASYNAASIYSAAYTYDKLSRITQKVETIGGVTDTFDYAYDLAGRLREVKKNTVVVATYTYDSNSNRQSFTGPGGTVTGTYDNQDRLTGYGTATYAYTANGELMTKTVGSQVTTYQYDVLGNIKSVTLPNGSQIDYLVDGKNRRIGKRINGTLVQGFLYQDLLNPAAELDSSNNIVSRFVYGSRSHIPDYMIKGGVTYRIISDHLGSPRLVVDTGTGAIMQRIDYDEFGNVLVDTNPGFQPFGFAAGLYDRDTGLIRFGARDCDPITGRWTVKDPILFDGGQANFYTYALNDPINLSDPEGLDLIPTTIEVGETYGPPAPPHGVSLNDLINSIKESPESIKREAERKAACEGCKKRKKLEEEVRKLELRKRELQQEIQLEKQKKQLDKEIQQLEKERDQIRAKESSQTPESMIRESLRNPISPVDRPPSMLDGVLRRPM